MRSGRTVWPTSRHRLSHRPTLRVRSRSRAIEEGRLITLIVVFGSLLVVAAWEFRRPRRQREFPALRRRFANIGFWVVNLALAAFIFEPAETFRPRLEAVLGIAFPSWPVTNAG